VFHITNGDGPIPAIREATGARASEVLPWRDVLHDGPVPTHLLDELRPIRARFIAERGWFTYDDAIRDFEERDRALASSLDHDEVVLWFEHDLYDQLQLIQILDWFAVQAFPPARLSLVCGPEYLGPSTPARLRERFPDRQTVTRDQLVLGRRAWRAFTSSEFYLLGSVIAGDMRALPFLAAAFERLLEEYPSLETGLTRTETQILEALVGEAMTMRRLYEVAHHKKEDPVFVGDASFFWYLDHMSRETKPLVTITPGESSSVRIVEATDFGRDVIQGRANRIDANGFDRWVGGVHLVMPAEGQASA
jgi:hypothetical protein